MLRSATTTILEAEISCPTQGTTNQQEETYWERDDNFLGHETENYEEDSSLYSPTDSTTTTSSEGENEQWAIEIENFYKENPNHNQDSQLSQYEEDNLVVAGISLKTFTTSETLEEFIKSLGVQGYHLSPVEKKRFFKMRRIFKNRRTAYTSRKRRKDKAKEIENKWNALDAENKSLLEQIEEAQKEQQSLINEHRYLMSLFQFQSSINLPSSEKDKKPIQFSCGYLQPFPLPSHNGIVAMV